MPELTLQQQFVVAALRSVGAIVNGVHVRYRSGRHGDTYIDKSKLYHHEVTAFQVATLLATQCRKFGVEVVAGPEKGGAELAKLVADALSRDIEAADEPQVEAVTVTKRRGGNNFQISPADQQRVDQRSVLVVDDVLTVGYSLAQAVNTVRAAGGAVVGAAALWNRGSVTAQYLGVTDLISLIDWPLSSWDPESESGCPLCQQHIPLSQKYGHTKRS